MSMYDVFYTKCHPVQKPGDTLMIKVQGLYQTYNNDEEYSVNNVTFEIPKGEVFGFLCCDME